MKTKTIIIIISIFAVIIALFFAVVLLCVIVSDGIRANSLKERMKVELPTNGIIMRYSEGLYPDYELLSENDFVCCDEDNIQITVFADGRAELKYIPPEENSDFRGKPPVMEINLSGETFDELKKRIDESGIRIISDVNRFYSAYSAVPSVSVISGKTVYMITEEMCEASENKYPEQSENCVGLIRFAADMLSSKDREEFDGMVAQWKLNDDFVFDFSEPLNDYLGEGDYDGVSMFRYYEELYGVDDPSWQGFQACLSVDASGRVGVIGSYSAFDAQGEKRFEEYKSKARDKISEDDLRRLQQLVQECHFEKYARETAVGYEVPAYEVDGDFQVVCFFTVACNGTKYYAVDDGSSPELHQLIQEYLDITTNGIKAEEAYTTTPELWDEMTDDYENFMAAA